MTAETHARAAESAEESGLGARGLRTREAIFEASRQLFLDRGYAGTRIGNITEACGISRAGFYTYFKDKREVVTVLGRSAYDDTLEVVGQWDAFGRTVTADDVETWVRRYFDHMDVHGAFIFSASHSAPHDEDFRLGARRMQMRVAFLFGVALRTRQATPNPAPEALGLTIIAMLDRAWYLARAQQLPVDDRDVIATCVSMIMATLTA